VLQASKNHRQKSEGGLSMTLIEFHFNAPERLSHTCKLLRKIRGRSLSVGVLGSEVVLRQLDAALWTFSELDFLPHSSPADDLAVQIASPIRLSPEVLALSGVDVLVNLSDDVPEGFDTFPRLIEIVPSDDHGKMTARTRWRRYTDLGFDLQRHDLSKLVSQ
jgi:DNA polymerase-3 subunit chi